MKRLIIRYAATLLAVMLLLSPACYSEGAADAPADLTAEDAASGEVVAAAEEDRVPEMLEDLELPSEDEPDPAPEASDAAIQPDDPDIQPVTPDAEASETPVTDAAEATETPIAEEAATPIAEEAATPVAEEAETPVAEEAAPPSAPAYEAAPEAELPGEPEPPMLAEAGGVPATLVLGVRERYQLTGGDAFASSRPKVVSVDAAGLLRARKKGRAVVTVTAGGAVVGVCEVTVKAAPKKVALPKRQTVALGQSVILTARVKGGACSAVTWTSGNPAVATVDANGFVTGVGVGKAKITARTYNKKKAFCTVTVSSPNAPARVRFPMSTLYVGKGESVTLRPVLDPGAEASLTYAVKNSKVASVTRNGGVVKGKKLNRSTKVTVKTQNGKKAVLTVKVLNAPTGIALNLPAASMGIGEVIELSAFLDAGTASQIAWASSDPGVAAVGEGNPFSAGNGGSMTVTALSAGHATITASTCKGQTAACEVTVKRSASGDDPQKTLNLLFIGNSHTYYNALPLMVQRRAAEAGYDCDVTRITASGWSLSQHTEDAYVSTAILNDGYHYVILQERVNPFDADAFLTAVEYLNGLIRQAGAVPVLYECWSKKDEPEKQAALNEAHRRVAERIGALLAPVGESWWDYRQAHPDVEMYAEDGTHASKDGSEYAAGIIWETIYSHLRG